MCIRDDGILYNKDNLHGICYRIHSCTAFSGVFYHAESQGGAIAAPNGDGALLALSQRFVITIFNSALIIRAHSWWLELTGLYV